VACALHPTLRRYVSPSRRQQILETANRLGYAPHHAARRLIRRRFQPPVQAFDQAGLIYFGGRAEFLDSVCLAMLLGAEQTFSELSASFLFINAGRPGGWEKVERTARSSGVDGWLVYGALDDEMADRLKRGGLPFVVVGDHGCTQPVHCARIDNVAVGRMAAQHLAARGHRRVAYLRGGDEDFVYQLEALAGFRAAASELGLDQDEELILTPAQWVGQRVIDTLWKRDSKPTALFASEFDLATGVAQVLRDAGFAVPGDLEVLGYELSRVESHANSTRLEAPMAEVGRQGAALLHRIAVEAATTPQEIKISPSLVKANTTEGTRVS